MGNREMEKFDDRIPSFHSGPTDPHLQSDVIGQLLEKQASRYLDRNAVIVPKTVDRITYHDLNSRTRAVARAMLAYGIGKGDRIGLLAGNVSEFAEVFLAATRIGAIAVLLNIMYTTNEYINALQFTGCCQLFTTRSLGKRDLLSCLTQLQMVINNPEDKLSNLKQIILMSGDSPGSPLFQSYDKYVAYGQISSEEEVRTAEEAVTPDTVCTFQFTSGTTGSPKAAMLTHYNLINNGFLVGHIQNLTERDIICCPSPLFHAAGLVLGLLGCLAHGSAIVLPSPTFDPTAVLDAIISESCTGLHGVPTMFADILDKYRESSQKHPIRLRTGVLGGAPVSRSLLNVFQSEFGMEDLKVGYGMTETSPISFMARNIDRFSAIDLEILPHTSAKVIDKLGNIVSRGTPGELCIAGYLLQTGYYRNSAKTSEAMAKDAKGTLWIYTGDQAIMDYQGHCRITGRIKEIIIRGGENIYPAEIENRLNEHPTISQACVVGVEDQRLGEAVAAFLQLANGKQPLPDIEIQRWVQETLGRHKTPARIFWMGRGGTPETFPITASGKIRKLELSAIGNKLVKCSSKL